MLTRLLELSSMWANVPDTRTLESHYIIAIVQILYFQN